MIAHQGSTLMVFYIAGRKTVTSSECLSSSLQIANQERAKMHIVLEAELGFL